MVDCCIGNISAEKTETTLINEASLRVCDFIYSKTAAKHGMEIIKKGPNAGKYSRPYMNSPHTINEIMAAKPPIPDPKGLAGGLCWNVSGTFRGAEGTWELVLHPETSIIYHFNFR